MSDTTGTRTVQNFRHEARGVLTQARETLAVRTDATGEVYSLLNGSIESILAGRPGYSQEEQVALLTQAKEQVAANREALVEVVEKAKAEALAQIEAWDFDGALAKTDEILTEAIALAAERDFDAHQQAKGRYSYPSYDESGDEEEPDDEEF